jgi:hypothetical protein
MVREEIADSAGLLGEREEEVHRPDLVGAQAMAEVLGRDDDGARVSGEAFEHGLPPRVLAVDGLLRDAERVRDLLPGPPSGAGVTDVEALELVEQATQRGNSPQPDGRVGAVEVAREVGGGSLHTVSIC